MEFLSFLEHVKNPVWWQKQSVVYCMCEHYQLLFFSELVCKLKKNGPCRTQAVDIADAPVDSMSAQLSSSFLGTKSVYWLKNIADLDSKKKSYWISYIQSYRGPNCLLLCNDKTLSADALGSMCYCQIPVDLDQSLCSSVLFFLQCHDAGRNAQLVRSIFRTRKKIELDTLCLLTHYATLAEKEFDLFLSQWLDMIVVPDTSLFDLSKHFFARNQDQFFRVWHALSGLYGEIFWVVYWADIVWRAYHFVRLSSLGRHDQAKKIGVRLPFSFLQGGWRQVSAGELNCLLNCLYALDQDIKNGVQGTQYIELLYLKFFLRQFGDSGKKIVNLSV